MANHFFCRNKDCDKYNQEIYFDSVVYVLRNGGLVPKEPLFCDHCGCEVEIVNVKSKGPISLNYNKFDSMSNADKKRWLLDRNKKVEKQDRDMKKFYEKKITGTYLEDD